MFNRAVGNIDTPLLGGEELCIQDPLKSRIRNFTSEDQCSAALRVLRCLFLVCVTGTAQIRAYFISLETHESWTMDDVFLHLRFVVLIS
jgi:hypothetical protein